MSKQVNRLRVELLKAVTPNTLRKVIKALIAKAEEGDIPAIRELLMRCLGEPKAVDVIERLEELEEAFEQWRDYHDI